MYVYLGEKGEMSCLSLDQVMVGGGKLWTSQGRVTSAPSTTDTLEGSAEPSGPPSPPLGLGRTGEGHAHKREDTNTLI